MKNILIVTQLSNYDQNGKFILEADSGWQMVMGRVRVMLETRSDLKIFVTGPLLSQCHTSPFELNRDLFRKHFDRIEYVPQKIEPNALVTRFDFNFDAIARSLHLGSSLEVQYDSVIINDPMLFRHYKSLFFIRSKLNKTPKFIVHSHFIDNPECPKFPVEASLWHGQIEAAIRADWNFWQCESSMNLFFESMLTSHKKEVVDLVRAKSLPWDDGFSTDEMDSPIRPDNVRFDVQSLKKLGKAIVFVPNRVGGRGRSSDYTNCGKFLFEVVPRIWKQRQDFVVLAGNPNQKFSNDELEILCPAYLKLVPDAFNRDEYKTIASLNPISVGLYNQDSYGGTASRELMWKGTVPLWVDNYEYSTIAKMAGIPKNWLVQPDFSDIDEAFNCLLDSYYDDLKNSNNTSKVIDVMKALRGIAYVRSSYEYTTANALSACGI